MRKNNLWNELVKAYRDIDPFTVFTPEEVEQSRIQFLYDLANGTLDTYIWELEEAGYPEHEELLTTLRKANQHYRTA